MAGTIGQNDRGVHACEGKKDKTALDGVWSWAHGLVDSMEGLATSGAAIAAGKEDLGGWLLTRAIRVRVVLMNNNMKQGGG